MLRFSDGDLRRVQFFPSSSLKQHVNLRMMILIYFTLLYVYITNVLLINSESNSSCIGCLSWKCDNYDSGTSSYHTCVFNDGCVYCDECDPSSISQCSSTCNMDSTCSNASNSDEATTWWLIAGCSIAILCCLFVFVIIIYIYKVTKDDHELAMLKIQRSNSRPKLSDNYSSSSKVHIKLNKNNRKNGAESPKLTPVTDEEENEDLDSDDIENKKRRNTSDEPPMLDRVTTESETQKDLMVDDAVTVHTIKISSPKSSKYYQQNSNNKNTDDNNDENEAQNHDQSLHAMEKPKMHRFDSV